MPVCTRGSSVAVRSIAPGAVTVVLGILVTVLVSWTFPPGGGPTAFDRAVAEHVHAGLDAHPGVFEVLVIPSNAPVLLALSVLGAILYALRRQWWRTVWLLAAPELAIAANTWVLKPVWDRPLDDYLSYPSGHTVHFVAVATALVLAATDRVVRIGIGVVATVLLAGVAIGMIGLGYHHATDVIGGTAAAVAMVTVLSWPAALLRRPASATPRTTPSTPPRSACRRQG